MSFIFLLKKHFFIIYNHDSGCMDRIGIYHKKPFSTYRKNITLIIKEGWRKHTIHELIEVDVTDGRKKIKDFKSHNDSHISFTGWIIKCAAQALSEHKDLNSYRKGNKIFYFDEVDVPIPIERKIGDESPSCLRY